MQSSASVMFRAMVMLACLVAIPLAAVFGGSLPEMFKTLLRRHWPSESASAHALPGDGSRFQPIGSTDAAGPATPDPNLRENSLPIVAPPKMGYADRPVPVSGTDGKSPVAVGPSDSAVARASAPVDQFIYLQDRLRKYGATHYLLESWGNQEQLYRFCCKMAVEGSPNYTRYFEATDSDPLRTMAQVLQQVEAWRAGRQ